MSVSACVGADQAYLTGVGMKRVHSSINLGHRESLRGESDPWMASPCISYWTVASGT